MYRTYDANNYKHTIAKRRRRFKTAGFLIITLFIIAAYTGYAAFRPLPPPKVVLTPPVSPALVTVNIPWPKSSPTVQAAYGADEYGLLAASSTLEKPMPMASIAKVITAMAVLEKHPLKPGEQGASIPLTAADVALYDKYLAKDGVVVPVSAGESLTQYQALQATLISSANNISDTLAIWAFGNLENYATFANGYIKKLGMNSTAVTDASGFSPNTVSTASDLIKLGDRMFDDPVMTEIVAQQSMEYPGIGTLTNSNGLLGQAGVRGIKTGNTDEAGGCFLGAADVKVGSETIRVITAVMGTPDVATAMRDTLPLIQSTPSQFKSLRIVTADQTVGTVTTRWGATSPVVTDSTIEFTAWIGQTAPALTSKTAVNLPAAAGSNIGELSLKHQDKTESSPLRLTQALDPPGIWWRLTHPF